jgi:hypothetical protein
MVAGGLPGRLPATNTTTPTGALFLPTVANSFSSSFANSFASFPSHFPF